MLPPERKRRRSGGIAGSPRGAPGLGLALLGLAWVLPRAPSPAAAQLRYSVPEELEHGAFVANLAEDLGLDVAALSARRLRLVPRAGAKQHLEVNLENGILFVNEKVDREELCAAEGGEGGGGGGGGGGGPCLLHLQLVVESPLELFRVEVEVLDINDHAPRFPWPELVLEVSESALPGARFPLEGARDPDQGPNALRTYRLAPNGFFSLAVTARRDGSPLAELVLERALDREAQPRHRLLLTALDGGRPERSGTARVLVAVLDANDNAPVFDRPAYSASLPEDAPPGTLVVRLNASDADEGANGEVEYALSGHAPPAARELFSVEPRAGGVRLRARLDFERAASHELFVQAKDRGPSAVAVHARVLLQLLDVNDNAPEVALTSLAAPVPEDAPPGTVVAVVSVRDRDSGDNGRVRCEIPAGLPFRLRPAAFPDYYTLETAAPLDREAVAEYNVTLTARDAGSPALATRRTLTLPVSDVNDNAPRFLQPDYRVYVAENNAPGASLCSVSARDPDARQNGYLSYALGEGRIRGMPVGTYLSVNADSGHVYALRSLDYEQLRDFRVLVLAQDAGFPPRSGNATLHVFVLDQNDNAPVFVAPAAASARNGSSSSPSSEAEEAAVPRGAEPGFLVATLAARDADAGQNARLSFQLLAGGEGLFGVAPHSGELRTLRAFRPGDPARHRLLLQVRDHGQPPLSASVALPLALVDGDPELRDPAAPSSPSSASSSSAAASAPAGLTLYLIVSLGAVSATFLVAILVLAALKCRKERPALGSSAACAWGGKRRRRRGGGEPGEAAGAAPEPFKGAHNNNHPLHQAPEAEGGGGGGGAAGAPPGYCYKVCLTPESAKSDFMFLKPYSPSPPRNNKQKGGAEKGPRGAAPHNNNNNGAASSAQVKQPNTDWLPSKQATLKSSQSLEDVGGVRRGVQKDHDRLRNLVTPVSDATLLVTELQKTPAPPSSVWTPRYAPMYSQPISPLDYQHNVYIPGTPTMPSSKDGPLFLEQETKNSFSTFGKRKKMTTYCDIHDNMIINNNLK